ncbi:MAG: hypothetical protein CSB44_00225 [Gammaproteobacteria bacterium]|nr:MAG: hypothetical protein CSB44_00225 [Gammaproteobacteria bacterium]
MTAPQQPLLTALRRVLRPLVRLLLRHGIAFSDFAEVARTAYVEVAHAEFPPPKRRQTQSNVAVITGLHRHEVKRILDRLADEPADTPRHNRAARVISGWQRDPEFSKDGQPRALGIKEEFKTLVARYSGDITPRAILDELLRVGAVCREGEALRLLAESYVPHTSDEALMRIFGDATADLIATIDHNLTHPRAEHRLQISVVYDNLPDERLDVVERESRNRSMVFLRDVDALFAENDRDANPAIEGSGRNRAGIGLFFFREHRPERDDTGENRPAGERSE